LLVVADRAKTGRSPVAKNLVIVGRWDHPNIVAFRGPGGATGPPDGAGEPTIEGYENIVGQQQQPDDDDQRDEHDE
jgi:hypothetical protein